MGLTRQNGEDCLLAQAVAYVLVAELAVCISRPFSAEMSDSLVHDESVEHDAYNAEVLSFWRRHLALAGDILEKSDDMTLSIAMVFGTGRLGNTLKISMNPVATKLST